MVERFDGMNGNDARRDAVLDMGHYGDGKRHTDAGIFSQAAFDDAVEVYAREAERRSIALRRARGQL